MLQIGICDDDVFSIRIMRRGLKDIGKKCGIDMEIYQFLSGMELINSNQEMDVLFLDIAMPEMDGIEVAKEFGKQASECKIIMATGTEDRYKEAFEVNAFRFITKPIQKRELERVLLAAVDTIKGKEIIPVYKERNLYQVCQRDISHIESLGSYVEVVAKGENFRGQTTLVLMEEVLEPELFCRVSRQHIVNLKWVHEFENDKVVMKNGESVKVSVRRKFEKRYVNYKLKYT